MASTNPTRRFRSSSAPIRPSPLSIPSGPTSPALPLTPPSSEGSPPPSHRRAASFTLCGATPPLSPSLSASLRGISSRRPPPPEQPLPWLWTCHLCDSTYSLGVTRKCLHDGHVFCSGTTRSKVTGQIKRHRSCASEFDYVGWGEWMNWRRDTTPEVAITKGSVKDCFSHCDYPSECRWGHNLSSSPTRKAEAKAEVDPLPTADVVAVERTTTTTSEIIVEQVVEAVKRTQKKNSNKNKKNRFNLQGLHLLSSIREEGDGSPDGMASPTSPLRQHYTLPAMEEMVTYYSGGDDLALSPIDEAPEHHDHLLSDVSSAFSMSSNDSDDEIDEVHGEVDTDLDAGITITPSTPQKSDRGATSPSSSSSSLSTSPSSSCSSLDDSSSLPDWADTDSDSESASSDHSSPELDLGLWDTRAGYFPIISPTTEKGPGLGRRVFGVGKGMTELARPDHVDVVDEKLLVDGITD